MDQLDLRINGVVQGVGYRAWTQRLANELGISGWVTNLSDGSVQVQAVGDRTRLVMMLDRCKEGPFHAKVTTVDARWGSAPAASGRFEIRR